MIIVSLFLIFSNQAKSFDSFNSLLVIDSLTLNASNFNGVNVSCNGDSNGSIDLTVYGGTLPFTFLWSGGETTEDISGLSAGTYSVTVIDATTDTLKSMITLIEPAVLTAICVNDTNVSCNGLADGEATVTAGGGTGPYTYLWSDAQTNATATGLAAATYTVTVTDFNGCINSCIDTISEPAVLTATCVVDTNVSCNGEADGEATVTAGGGTSPYAYLWSDGQTNATGTGLSATTYTVTVSDINACTSSCDVTLIEPPALNINCALDSNVSCNGFSDGGATAIASGGIPGYSYLWSNGISTGSATNLIAGIYTVTVTDNIGCTNTCDITITEPAVLTATCVLDSNISCNGLTDGQASVTAGGGTAPYTYSWSDAQTNTTATGLAAATYTVTVTDFNGCIDSCDVTISEPAVLTATCVVDTNVSCTGEADGEATVSAGGGTGPYTYLWSDAQTNTTATGLAAATYTVTVTDFNGCIDSCDVTISEPAVLTATCVVDTNVSCTGEADGEATVSAGGGTGPYTYLWSDAQTNATATGLAAATYTVTVTDFNGCTNSCDVTISEPAVLTATCVVDTNVSCNGVADGEATVTAGGGTAPYTYSWSDAQTNATATGLAAATYTVTVTDFNGCTNSCINTILEPAVLTATCVVDTNVSCNGEADGEATVTAGGGTGPYTYLWSDAQTNATATGLAAATYTVTVTDFNGCTNSCDITISEPAVLTATCVVDTNVSCNGEADGEATVTAGGGTGPYTYLWSDAQTNATATGLADTTYTVTVTDFNGCTNSCDVTISEPAVLTATCVVDTNVSCTGEADGEATVTAGGGTGPYIYLWSDAQTNTTATGLAAATYTVTVTDFNGCTNSCDVTISEPAVLTATCVVDTNVSCNGVADGEATVTAVGGTGPYTYLWSDAQTNATATGLAAATYTVTVTDFNGCTNSCIDTISEPAVLTATCVVDTNVSCNGEADGEATVTAGGGTGPYTYLWSDAQTNATATGLAAATYTVTVTDFNGCTNSCDAIITEAPAILPLCSVIQLPSCSGFNDGIIDVSVSGGVGPYSVLWSNGDTTLTSSNLGPAIYTVTVTDAAFCTSTCTITLTQPAVLTLICSEKLPVACFGDNTGQAEVMVSGGTIPYTYLWSDGQTDSVAINLLAGNYQVTVTDANGCNDTCSVVINQPPSLGATCSILNDVSCNGGSNGSATVVASGGIGSYSYLWSNGQTTSTAINLIAATYTVTVQDINNCTSTCSITVAEPTVLVTICLLDSAVTCNGLSDGGASVNASGGTAPYGYLWNNGQTTSSAINLSAGTYTVTVTDSLGCVESCTILISEPAVLVSNCTVNQNVSCNGGNDGIVSVLGFGGTLPYTYLWSTGDTTSSIDSLIAGNYTVTITDAKNCTASCMETVTQPLVLSLVCSIDTNVTCNGGNDGVASVLASDGTAPYSYMWDNGQTTIIANGLSAGVHTVTVTDINLCSDTCHVIISEPSALIINCNVDNNVSCNGLTDGEASVSVSGGVGPYTYMWNIGSTNSSITGLAPGTYTVTVTDNNLCTSACFVSITQPAVLSLSIIDSIDAKCFGASDGSISVNVSGGTLPFSFLWSNSSTSQNLSNAPAGSYTLVVTDNNGCVDSVSSSFGEPTALVVSIDTVNGICGFPNGQAISTPSGATPAYTYLWSNGSTDSIVTGLAQATYTVTITDANSCTVTATAVVLNTGPVLLQLDTVINATCNAFSDGYLEVSGVDGVAPYAYLWSTSSTNNSISGLIAGNYTVTVTDNVGCTHSAVYVVGEPLAVSAIWTVTNPSCGLINGILLVNGVGGTGPYTYLWSTGETTNSIDTLNPGTYTVTVTGLNGCIGIDSMTIADQPGPIVSIGSISNTSCNGGADGSVNINVSSGTPPLTYLWSNAQSNQDLINATAGPYMATVTDVNGCFDTLSVFVSEPSAIAIVFDTTSATCNLANGSALAMVSGGSGAYTYLWSTGATIDSISSVIAGAYVLTVTDANLCTATANVVISNIGGPILSTDSIVDVSCFAGSNGSIYINSSSGAPPFTFLWSNGATTEDLVNVLAGNYTLTVTDNIGCVSNILNTINQPVDIGIFFNVMNETCNKANGSIVTGIIGGVPGYSYLWSNGNTNSGINSLSAGPYTLTITDANGCTKSSTATVFNIPGPLLLTDSVLDVKCNGDSTGEAYITVFGGTAPFSYNWSNGSTSEDLLNVPIGAYTVTVTDANLCTISTQVIINEPSALTLSVNSVSSTCGDANGGAIATPGNGTPSYTYLWSNGTTNSTMGGVFSGLYTITVTDNNGCTILDTITINNIPGPTLAIDTIIHVDCFGNNTGGISINVIGGTPGFTYLWSNSASTQTISNLLAGAYTVTVSDNNNCTAIINATVNEPPLLHVNITNNSSTCSSNNGSASASASGGVSPYAYLWSNGVTVSSISGVFAGIYTVTVTDANNCTTTLDTNILDIPGPTICIDSIVNVDCFGSNTGLIDVCLTNGTAPFSFLWSNGNTTDINANLFNGIYTVTVQDANACIASLSIAVAEPSALSLSVSSISSTCGYANGTATAVPSGGTPAYAYLWSNSLTTNSINGLLAGVYTVTVTDINACTQSGTITVTDIPGPILSVDSILDVDCFSSATGSIFVSHTLGTPAFTYSWSNSNTTEDLLNVVSGAYTLIITDSNNCKDTISAIINEPSELLLTTNQINSICTDANGSATVIASGGTIPYSYLWSNGNTNSTINSLLAGSYTVTVTDANLCSKTDTVVITTTTLPFTNLDSIKNVSCFTGSDGYISIVVSNGTSPFTYNWNNGNTTTTNNNLTAGLYTVIITDSLFCVDTAAYIIFEPTLLTVSVSGNDAFCTDGTGSALAVPAGGTAPYTYVWSGSDTTAAISNLIMGIYTVTVTDAQGCTVSDTVVINYFDSPIATINLISNVTCYGFMDGAININVANGASPYSYFWSNGETTEDIDSLISNVYTVFVIDTNSCSDTLSVFVSQPGAITATFNVNNANCGVANGSATVIPGGGTPGYSYLWSTGSTVNSIVNQLAGTYTIIITDSIFCDSTYTVNINNDGAPTVNLDSIHHVTCNGFSDGLITVNVFGGLAPYTYLWSSGDTTQNISNVTANSYTLTITDANGCVITSNYIITEPLLLVANTVTVDATCALPNGSVAVAVIGGTSPYTYLWSSGSTTNNATAQPGGPISVLVTDSNNCNITVFDTIFDAGNPAINLISLNNNLCFGDSVGIINLFAVGGSPSYAYNWSNGKTTEDISGLVAGIYTLTVTDLLSCTATSSFTISQPSALLLSINSFTPICNTSNGTLDAVVSGGISGYTYLWSNGDTTSGIDSLGTGTYTVTVTDANNCTKSLSASLTDNGNPVVTLDTIFNVKCFGALTGQIFISTSAGTQPYTYLWSNSFTVEDLLSIGADVYTVNVVDSNGCTSSSAFTVSEPAELIVTLIPIPATCDSINGAINSSVIGGVSPYEYLWSTAGTDSFILNQNPGVYTLQVTDSNNCVSLVSDSILDLFSPQITLSLLKNVSCTNGSDGIIDVNVIGPSQPFQYLWSTNDSVQDLIGIAAGTYTLTVTDTNNCISTYTETITQPGPLGIVTNIVQPSCNLSNGSISVSGFGGTGPYSYLWASGSTSDSIVNLNTGTFTVTITDALNCDSTFVYSLLNTGNPIINLNLIANVSCFGGSDGSIAINIGGGVPGYTYLWSNGDTTQNISGLSVGLYTVVVTDTLGCVGNNSFPIGQPSAAISIAFNTVPPSCGVSTGSACANIVGGTPGYTYLWSNLATSACINNIAAGTYTVTITDANLCTKSGAVNLSDLTGPQIVSVDSSDASCPGFADGSISLVITASNPPYTIAWTNTTQTSDTITGLTSGTYTVTITDTLGCIATRDVTVGGPDSWNVIDSIPNLNGTFNVSCNGLKDASITLTVSGGSQPYTFNWSNGANMQNLSNIGAGTYTILITDIKGCDTTITYTVTQPPPLFGNPMGNLNVCGITTAMLSADDPPTGAIGYWVSLSPLPIIDDSASSNTSVSNLQPDNNIFYWVITDSICFDSAQVIIISSNEITAIAGIDKVVCENMVTLTATPTLYGFGYWTLISGSGIINDSTMATTLVTNLQVGPNEFLWTVVNGDCRDSALVIITLDNPLDCIDPLEMPTGLTPNNDTKNDYFVIKGIEAYPVNELLVYNRWGNLVFDQKNYDNTWDGINNSGDDLPDGTYFVIFRINNGEKTINGYVDIRRR